jgi:hypothetical protein
MMPQANTITVQFGGAINLILGPPAASGYVLVTAKYDRFTVTGKGEKMAYTLPIDMLINVQVAYVDRGGNPAVVDGDVKWSSSNASAVLLTIDPRDSTICRITPAGKAATVQVIATADADLGEGVRELITTLDLNLVPAEAVAGTIAPVGDPQPIGAHPEQRPEARARR